VQQNCGASSITSGIIITMLTIRAYKEPRDNLEGYAVEQWFQLEHLSSMAESDSEVSDNAVDPRHRYSGPQEQPWDLPENNMKNTNDLLLDMERKQGWFERQSSGMTSPNVSGHLVSNSQSPEEKTVSVTDIAEHGYLWHVQSDEKQQKQWEDRVPTKDVTAGVEHPSDSVNCDEKVRSCIAARKWL
jgi:hypothetical protein